MSIKLNGATDGSIQLDVPAAIGSDLNVTLPATAGEVAVKATDGSVDLGDVNIDSGGRLLVGATTSQGINSGLQVVGDTGATIHRGNATAGNAPQLRFTRSRNTNYGSFTSVQNGDELGKIAFAADDGTDYSTQAATITAFVDAAPGANDMPGGLVFSTTAGGASSPTERMRIRSTGRVNIVSSYTTGSPQLYVENAASASGQQGVQVKLSSSSNNTSSFIFIGSSNGNRVYIYGNGNVVNANNSYGAISDAKLKENIVDASSQWDDLKALQVRKYNFKEGQTHTQIGVVAQEVETVSPGLVTESPDRDEEGNDLGTVTKSVNYSVLYMKAVKALQEAMDRIETLEAKVAALEANP